MPPSGLTLTSDDVEHRFRSVRFIGLWAAIVTIIYVIVDSVLGLTELAIYNGVFLAGYGIIVSLITRERVRVLGIVLVGAGLTQLAGTAILYLPPSSGTHFFFLVIPIWAVVGIDHRDKFWWMVFSAAAIVLIVFFEIERDTYMPPRWVPIEGIDHSYFRALAALFTITLSFTAFEGFHRDLLRARHALRESHERSEGQLRAMLIRERANAERQLEFFSRVSHELRTPLAAIGAASDLLSQHRRKMTDEQITARVEKIQSSVKGLQGLIAETLDLSRIRTASLSSEETEFDLCEVTRDVFNTSRLFVDTDIPAEIITPEAALFVTMDEKLFRHVADNLITNGFKYAGDGQLRVELSEADETLSLTVQDTGIGMSETDLQQLFIPFHRGRNVAGIDGTGLGMTVVQEATSLLGGRLKIESELGVGTTASVALPRHPVADHEWDDMSEFMFPATRHGG